MRAPYKDNCSQHFARNSVDKIEKMDILIYDNLTLFKDDGQGPNLFRKNYKETQIKSGFCTRRRSFFLLQEEHLLLVGKENLLLVR